jgi:hypothetical protein
MAISIEETLQPTMVDRAERYIDYYLESFFGDNPKLQSVEMDVKVLADKSRPKVERKDRQLTEEEITRLIIKFHRKDRRWSVSYLVLNRKGKIRFTRMP